MQTYLNLVILWNESKHWVKGICYAIHLAKIVNFLWEKKSSWKFMTIKLKLNIPRNFLWYFSVIFLRLVRVLQSKLIYGHEFFIRN
jgi:hypothetical protein